MTFIVPSANFWGISRLTRAPFWSWWNSLSKVQSLTFLKKTMIHFSVSREFHQNMNTLLNPWLPGPTPSYHCVSLRMILRRWDWTTATSLEEVSPTEGWASPSTMRSHNIYTNSAIISNYNWSHFSSTKKTTQSRWAPAVLMRGWTSW